MVKTGPFEAIDSLIPLDEHLATFRGSGYQEKDKTKAKPDKTEHEIGKSARIRVRRSRVRVLTLSRLGYYSRCHVALSEWSTWRTQSRPSPRPDPDPDPDPTQSKPDPLPDLTRLLTGGQPPLTGGVALVTDMSVLGVCQYEVRVHGIRANDWRGD
ncbi:hypothetical protein Tco_0740233 [Tanacetum coccineum]